MSTMQLGIKKMIACICFLFCAVGSIWAQEADKNALKVVVFNNLTYVKQETKPTVGSVLGTVVDLLSGKATNEHANYQESVRANIIKGMSQARRVSIMDGTGMERADWYVDGTLSNISSTSKTETYKDKNGKPYTQTYYKAFVGVTLQVKDAQTNEVIASPTFNISDFDISWVETREGAVNSALLTLSRYITKYFNKQLPLFANIIEGARDKKDKSKEVYIDLGESTKGMAKGIHFGVFRTKMVAGKESRMQIGKLKVSDIQGDDVSLCKVTSGGKDIKIAIENNETLTVKSVD